MRAICFVQISSVVNELIHRAKKIDHTAAKTCLINKKNNMLN